MVRREEQPWQSRATLFLDNRLRAHRGQGIASSLEAAVSAAASIAVHLEPARLHRPAGDRHRRGPGQLLALPRRRPQHRPAARGAGRRPGRCTRPHLDTGWLAEAAATAASPSRSSAASRPRPAGAAPDAATTPARRWRSPSTSTPGLARAPRAAAAPPSVLAQQGWRAVSLGPRDRLDAVWQELGRSGSPAPRRGPCGPPTAPVPEAARVSGRRRRPRAPASVLAVAAAATTWVAMCSWRGFTEAAGPLPRPAAPARRRGGRRRRPGRWWRLPRRRRGGCRCSSPGLVASTLLCGSPAAGRPRLGPAARRLRRRRCTASRRTPPPVPAQRAAGVTRC